MEIYKKEKKLTIKCKALKWVKTNSASPKDHLDRFPWQMG
jgi:hypothetical protein